MAQIIQEKKENIILNRTEVHIWKIINNRIIFSSECYFHLWSSWVAISETDYDIQYMGSFLLPIFTSINKTSNDLYFSVQNFVTFLFLYIWRLNAPEIIRKLTKTGMILSGGGEILFQSMFDSIWVHQPWIWTQTAWNFIIRLLMYSTWAN